MDDIMHFVIDGIIFMMNAHWSEGSLFQLFPPLFTYTSFYTKSWLVTTFLLLLFPPIFTLYISHLLHPSVPPHPFLSYFLPFSFHNCTLWSLSLPPVCLSLHSGLRLQCPSDVTFTHSQKKGATAGYSSSWFYKNDDICLSLS